jgi:ribosome biogenesis GTPase
MVSLEQLGWDAGWENHFAAHRETGLCPGRVALEDKHAFVAVTIEGEIAARVAGRILHERPSPDLLPKVGDWVALSHKPRDARSVIQAILPRRTSLTRKVPGRENAPQVLAANIDVAFVVQALDAELNLRRLERFLVMVHEGGAQAVVVLNKADLAMDLAGAVAQARPAIGATPMVVASAHAGAGMDELRKYLPPGRTGVFVGTSGVGKSSLINRLHGEPIQATLEVREHDRKGRHSTSWRELILLRGGGLVIDTPGLREFHLWLAEGGLDEAFPEVAALATHCRFRACSHTTERNCAVQAAVLEGTLSSERLASFQKLRHELDYLARERRDHTYLARRREATLRRRRSDDTGSNSWLAD